MPKKENAAKKTEQNEEKKFEEFNLTTSQNISFSGRFYLEPSGDNVKKYYMNLSIVKDFSISCHLVDAPSTYFIAFPQYESGSGKNKQYKSYIFIPKDSNMSAALDELADLLYNSFVK